MKAALFIRWVAVAAGFFVAWGPAAAASVEIELRPQVTVAHRPVRLGDVAYLRTDDLSLMRHLMALPLGPAPQPGDVAVLEREALARWVRVRGGLMSSQVEWTGADSAQLRSRGVAAVFEVQRESPPAAPQAKAPVQARASCAECDARPAVARGQQVTLRMNAGAVALEGRAESLQDGEVGQTVSVRLAGATAAVPARVVAHGQVEAMP